MQILAWCCFVQYEQALVASVCGPWNASNLWPYPTTYHTYHSAHNGLVARRSWPGDGDVYVLRCGDDSQCILSATMQRKLVATQRFHRSTWRSAQCRLRYVRYDENGQIARYDTVFDPIPSSCLCVSAILSLRSPRFRCVDTV